MATKSAQQALAAWKQAMANPQTSQNYVAGINAVTESPMEKAAAAADQYQAGVMQAVASGKFAANLRAVPLSTYKQNAVAVGAPRLATGAQKASPKYERFVNKYAPVWAQMQDAAKAVQGTGMGAAVQKFQASLAVLMAASGKG